MEKFSELIKMRRSMRKFTPEKLTDEQLRTVLRAALMSPSSKGTHCWQFVVVQDGETLAQLSRCKAQGADFLSGAPCGVVVLADPAVSDVWRHMVSHHLLPVLVAMVFVGEKVVAYAAADKQMFNPRHCRSFIVHIKNFVSS